MNRNRAWELLEAARPGDRFSRAVDFALIGLIVANVVAVIVGSMASIGDRYAAELWWFEVFSVAVFTIEYIARLWACRADARFNRRLGRLHYAMRPMAIIDLLAILPFYLPFLGFDARVVRVFRVFRLLRVLKLGRYSRALRMIGRVLVARREELLLSSVSLLFLLLVSATLMYYAEHDAQPEQFSSIPATLWWAVVTLTTVGYGDVYPITVLGKLFGGAIAILGIGMVALPAGIISSGFIEEIEARRREALARVCPHCGKPVQD